MKPSITSAALLALALGSFLPAHAAGGSSGCSDARNGPLGQALKVGKPADVEREITRWLDAREQGLGLGTQATHAVLGEGRRQEWRAQETRNLVEGVQDEAACAPTPLLPVAMQAGNLDVVRFLLGKPLGVSPRMPPAILFSCKDEAPQGQDAKARRQEAFTLVLATGAVDMNGRNAEGRTVLQACYEPELLALFVKRGARLDVEIGSGATVRNPLEQAIVDAVQFKEGSPQARRLHGLERARLFAGASGASGGSIRGRPIEARIRGTCNLVLKGRRWNPETCGELAGFIQASPGTFGP
jgi:hypothetical protein